MDEQLLKLIKRFDERITKLEKGQSFVMKILNRFIDNIKTCVYGCGEFNDLSKHYNEVHKKKD